MKKFKRKKVAILLIALFAVGFIAVGALVNITSVLQGIAKATMSSITTEAVNDAVYYTLSDGVRYEQLVTVERDAEGNILSITSNALQINRIARDAAYMSQRNLNEMSGAGVNIPVGALTGLKALAGVGPVINLKIIPICNVECKFSSSFESVGINQTKHSIYLNVIADITIVMMREVSNFASTTEVLICESVIVGKLPIIYMESDVFENQMDLVP